MDIKYRPFSSQGIDTLAQCPKCLRTWSYDSLDALIDMGKQNVAGYRNSRNCPGCGVPAKLFQSIEKHFVRKDGKDKRV